MQKKLTGNYGTGAPAGRKEQRGLFVISLDFELYWGVRDVPKVGDYTNNLVGARAAIPAILDLFTEHGIHATWATVGFLFADSSTTLKRSLPRVRPHYLSCKLSPYGDLPAEEAVETSDSVFFAPSLIRMISATANQEIASHTFSHYYCLEKGQNQESFRADLEAARSTMESCGLKLNSLAFPRNQYREEYLESCADAGIIAYRGNPKAWLYRGVPSERQGRLRRMGRLLDAYFPLCRNTCHAICRPAPGLPVNVCASRFLRPYVPALGALEVLRLRRIMNEMTSAAKSGRMYHLWWHPHNFGVNTERNVRFLRKLLNHYACLSAVYGMISVNMREVAERSFVDGCQVV